jgi:hypothetical protein
VRVGVSGFRTGVLAAMTTMVASAMPAAAMMSAHRMLIATAHLGGAIVVLGEGNGAKAKHQDQGKHDTKSLPHRTVSFLLLGPRNLAIYVRLS